LLEWKCIDSSTMIVSTGTPTFHHVAVLFVLASQRTPRKLIAVNTAISPIAIAMPVPVSTCWPFCSFIHDDAQE
jgi:hypothetical protein